MASWLTGGGGGNYAYVTARVRAKKAHLLPGDTFEKLLAMDVHEIARFLEERGYKREVDELAGKFSGARLIEAATRLNLGRTYQDVIFYCTGELKTVVERYLTRYDVYNIKTILRGRFAKATEEEVRSQLLPAGALAVEDLQGLLRLADMDEVVNALAKSPFGSVLKTAVEAGGRENLAHVENALDREYFRMLLQAMPEETEAVRALRTFLSREVDTINLKTVLRLRADHVEEAGDLLIPGGTEVKEDRARRLLRAGATEVGQELDGTDLWTACGEGIRAFLATGDMHAAATAIDRFLIARASSFSHRYPLSVLPVIDFVLRKRREVDNLRVLAFGKQAGLPETVIKELVIA